MHELHSYVWAYYDEYKELGIPVDDNIKLINATNPNIETIRRSIIPTQLCQIKYNTNYSTDYAVFEIGRVVEGLKPDGLCNERKKLAVTVYSKTKSYEELYMGLRDALAVVADDIKHMPLEFEKITADKAYQHPKNLNKILCGGAALGEMGIVHPVVSKKIDKKAAIVYAEIDVSKFAEIENAGIVYDEPSKYPEMEIDVTFVSPVFAPIGKAIADENCSLIKSVRVADTYGSGENKAITVRIVFSHPERTLTKDEVMEVVDSVIDKLKARGIQAKSI